MLIVLLDIIVDMLILIYFHFGLTSIVAICLLISFKEIQYPNIKGFIDHLDTVVEDKEKMIGVPTIIINNKYTYTATYPKKDGYKFDGWYYDKELTQKLPELFSKIDMELLKSNGYNLYGKWIEGIDDNQNKYEFGKNVYNIMIIIIKYMKKLY